MRMCNFNIAMGVKHQVRPTDNRGYILDSFTVSFSSPDFDKRRSS